MTPARKPPLASASTFVPTPSEGWPDSETEFYSRTRFLGVDCGITGGLCVLDSRGTVLELLPMPTLGKGASKKEYDLAALRDFFRLYDDSAQAMVERLTAMPMEHGGSLANYGRGRALALIEMALCCARLPYQLVSPRKWQATMYAGIPESVEGKDRSLLACSRLFPKVSLLASERSRKPHEGLADALLVAEYGRRTLAVSQARGAGER